MGAENYYDILGLKKGAGDEDVKQAFRELAKNLHPDRNPGDAEAERQFKLVNTAYEALKDGSRRRAYDEWLTFARNHERSRLKQWGRLAALVAVLLLGPSAALYWAVLFLNNPGPSRTESVAVTTTPKTETVRPPAVLPSATPVAEPDESDEPTLSPPTYLPPGAKVDVPFPVAKPEPPAVIAKPETPAPVKPVPPTAVAKTETPPPVAPRLEPQVAAPKVETPALVKPVPPTAVAKIETPPPAPLPEPQVAAPKIEAPAPAPAVRPETPPVVARAEPPAPPPRQEPSAAVARSEPPAPIVRQESPAPVIKAEPPPPAPVVKAEPPVPVASTPAKPAEAAPPPPAAAEPTGSIASTNPPQDNQQSLRELAGAEDDTSEARVQRQTSSVREQPITVPSAQRHAPVLTPRSPGQAAPEGAARSMARMIAEVKEPKASASLGGEASERNQRQAAIQPEPRRVPSYTPMGPDDFADCYRCPVMSVVATTDLLARPGYRPSPPVRHGRGMRNFAISKYEVTVGEMNACVEEGACRPSRNSGPGEANRPVQDLTRAEAAEYAEWLSRKTGQSYRLLKPGGWGRAAGPDDDGDVSPGRGQFARRRDAPWPPPRAGARPEPFVTTSGFRVTRIVRPDDG